MTTGRLKVWETKKLLNFFPGSAVRKKSNCLYQDRQQVGNCTSSHRFLTFYWTWYRICVWGQSVRNLFQQLFICLQHQIDTYECANIASTFSNILDFKRSFTEIHTDIQEKNTWLKKIWNARILSSVSDIRRKWVNLQIYPTPYILSWWLQEKTLGWINPLVPRVQKIKICQLALTNFYWLNM